GVPVRARIENAVPRRYRPAFAKQMLANPLIFKPTEAIIVADKSAERALAHRFWVTTERQLASSVTTLSPTDEADLRVRHRHGRDTRDHVARILPDLLGKRHLRHLRVGVRRGKPRRRQRP